MTLRVTNTLTGETEPFEPDDPDTVTLYLCGLTTSDPPHLGHARTWVHTDVIHRWLAHEGYDVRHVENFTDVNEKIVARVGETGPDGTSLGADEAAVAETYIGEVIDAMRALNLERADVYPRVSEHVPEIIEMVETLIDRGHAYEVDGSVYFDVTSFEDYGALSNQDVDALSAQGDPEERSEKRNAADFALWKAGGVEAAEIESHQHEGAAPATEACKTAQTWESPWGEGRPGWHIECSAMSTTHLGETFDIHVAGQDIIFPHNENEIAQSEAATGEPFARYWVHVRLLETKGEKMSSSLGNFATVGDAVAEHGPNAIRTFLLSTSYSNRATFSEETIQEGIDRWERLARGYDRAVTAADSTAAATKVTDDELRAAIEDTRADATASMNDDFNTRGALAALLELVGAVHDHVDAHEEYDYQALRESIDVFDEFGGDVLGLQFGASCGSDELTEDLVEYVLRLRADAREAGEYERADALRDSLAELGVEVEDTDDGVTYRIDD